jgi:hypothetical protein
MKAATSLRPCFPRLLFALIAGLAAALATGCGGGSMSPSPVLKGNTAVTVLLSSAANDQLSQFSVSLDTLTLANNAGKTVSLLSATQQAEFLHVNGGVEPLLTLSIPQDVYITATATSKNAFFSCETLNPSGGLVVSTFAFQNFPAPITMNLPAPITVAGTNMGLSLNMLVSQSASFTSCDPVGIQPFSINPVFNLTPVALSAQPTPKTTESDLDGQIVSVNAAGSSFNLVLADGQTLKVNSKSSTLYQGVGGLPALAAGGFVNMDAALQSDGSQLATRVAVEDSDPTNQSVRTGPVLQTNSAQPMVTGFGQQQEGYFASAKRASIWEYYGAANTTFQISGRFTNLPTLPFVPNFSYATTFPGQNVSITTHAVTVSGHYPYEPATTITLRPQTMNGTVTASSTSGNFQVYTVALAPYALPPLLAVQPGQSQTITHPGTVEVYLDSATQHLNTTPLAVGSVLRFNGLLFNDNGTLRMDCGQVNDGVAQ